MPYPHRKLWTSSEWTLSKDIENRTLFSTLNTIVFGDEETKIRYETVGKTLGAIVSITTHTDGFVDTMYKVKFTFFNDEARDVAYSRIQNTFCIHIPHLHDLERGIYCTLCGKSLEVK